MSEHPEHTGAGEEDPALHTRAAELARNTRIPLFWKQSAESGDKTKAQRMGDQRCEHERQPGAGVFQSKRTQDELYFKIVQSYM